jgi:hypothetical protein
MNHNFARNAATATIVGLMLTPAFALAAEATFDRTLNVSGSVTVDVSTGSGYVHISPGSDNQVHIVGHVKAGHGGWFQNGSPEERVRQVADHPPIEQSGSSIRIGKQQGNWLQNISIDYDITMPRNTQLDASSGSGDLRISNISGGVKANTGSGDIEASGIGGFVALETGSGTIHGDLTNAHDVKAQTGSGDIQLRNVQGMLKAGTGSGSIDVAGQPTAPWKLETGSGNVTLTTGNAHFSLDASTGSGSVHSDPPMTTHGSLERHHVSGDINGGGPTVRVETGSGDIRIH